MVEEQQQQQQHRLINGAYVFLHGGCRRSKEAVKAEVEHVISSECSFKPKTVESARREVSHGKERESTESSGKRLTSCMYYALDRQFGGCWKKSK